MNTVLYSSFNERIPNVLLEPHGRNGQDAPDLIRADETSAASTRRLLERLLEAEGIVLILGFPIGGGDEAVCARAAAFGRFLGSVILQGPDRSPIDRVHDLQNPTIRGSKTRQPLPFHTDMARVVPDYVGMLAVREASSGGGSMFVHARDVVSALRRTAPAALERLRRPFHFDLREVDSEPLPPLSSPIVETDPLPRLFYNRARIHRGYKLMGQRLSSDDLAALDALDEIVTEKVPRTELTLRAGQLVMLSNRSVLHARAGFEDTREADAGAGRLLLRLWLRRRRDSSVEDTPPD